MSVSQGTGLQRVAVIGAGAWGTALALAATRAGREVTLLVRSADQAAEIAASGRNPRLPGIVLPETIAIRAGVGRVESADLVILATPTQSAAAALRPLRGMLRPGTPVIGAFKGIERGSGRFVTQIIEELTEAQPAILSGPGFADDVACGLPTALTLAAKDGGLAQRLAQALSSPAFRLYHTADIRGVEIGGAAKNVLAIASGISAGRGLGASASAAIISRGFAELSRFARAYGAMPATLMGLSGLGDLVLTATSPQSRNFALGHALGRGLPLDEALASGLAEGVPTAAILVRLAQERGVAMPIAEAVGEIVAGVLDVDTALRELLARPLRPEGDES